MRLLIDLNARVCSPKLWCWPLARWVGRHWQTRGGDAGTGARCSLPFWHCAGIRDGIVFGRSDRDAARPFDRPFSPERLTATVYHAVGIDPPMRLLDPQGRPVPIVEQAEPRRVSRDGGAPARIIR